MKGVLGRFRRPDPAECESVRGLMSDYVDGELEADGNEQVEAHVVGCPGCWRVLTNLRVTLKHLGLLGQAPPVGIADIDGMIDRINAGWRDRG